MSQRVISKSAKCPSGTREMFWSKWKPETSFPGQNIIASLAVCLFSTASVCLRSAPFRSTDNITAVHLKKHQFFTFFSSSFCCSFSVRQTKGSLSSSFRPQWEVYIQLLRQEQFISSNLVFRDENENSIIELLWRNNSAVRRRNMNHHHHQRHHHHHHHRHHHNHHHHHYHHHDDWYMLIRCCPD